MDFSGSSVYFSCLRVGDVLFYSWRIEKLQGGFLDPGDRRLLLQEHQQGDIALVIFANSSYLCFVP